MPKINNRPPFHDPNNRSRTNQDGQAENRYTRDDTPKSLFDFHFICPMPRAIVPSKLVLWCRENIEHGWMLQFPRKGTPSFRTAVFLFEDYNDCVRFRERYCYDDVYNKRPHEADYMQALGDNE